MRPTTKALAILALVWGAAGTQAGGCGGGGGGGGDVVVDPFPAGEVLVTAANLDPVAYRLEVLTFDSTGGPLVVIHTIVCDPIAGAVGPDPGAGGDQVELPPSSPTIEHYFAIYDTGGGGLVDTSTEYVKGPTFQVAVVTIDTGAVSWSN